LQSVLLAASNAPSYFSLGALATKAVTQPTNTSSNRDDGLRYKICKVFLYID